MMDPIQSRQQESLSAATVLLSVSACGLLYVLTPPALALPNGSGFRIERLYAPAAIAPDQIERP